MKKRIENLNWRDNLFTRQKEYVYWIILILLGGGAVILMRYLTPYGMGLVNDSVAYIGGARNILAGHGFSRMVGDGTFEPYTHFPPFFSIILASVSLFGIDAIRAARLVVLLLFGANTILIGIILRKLTRNQIASIGGAIFFLISEPILRVHSYALSEPLYIFLCFLALLLLIENIEKDHWLFLAGAGLLTSLALLTRYVGISLYLLAFLVLSITSKSWKKWFRNGLIFGAASLPLVGVWLLRNKLLLGNATNRSAIWHPVEQDVIQEGLERFWGWLLPERGHFLENYYFFWLIAFLILMAGLAYILYRILRKEHVKPDDKKQPGLLPVATIILHAFSYLVVVLVSMTLFDDSTRFEHRILVPFTISFLLLLVWGLTWVWKHPGLVAKGAVILVCVGLALFVAEDTLDTVKELHAAGQGFASGRWTNSELIDVMKTLPEDEKIFSNRITATYLLANRPSFIIPWKTNPVTGLDEPAYQKSIEIDRQMVMDGEALIVIFDYDYHVETGNIPIIDLTKDLPVYQRCSDGVVFGLRD